MPRRLDDNAQRILWIWPDAAVERASEVIQAAIEGDRGIVVLVTADGFEIRLPTTEHRGGFTHDIGPTTRFRERIPADVGQAELYDRLLVALRARAKEFKPCRFCGEPTPVESRVEGACWGCASDHLGIIF